ncbi:guanylate-binding protein 2-like [Myotis myotis]|uniref:guanylate-binding protein 2-like n=1 Tax=Myotis myotis TaxID=51298 RepID=UPI00174B1C9B|nr:guanylate-binding protein 2-like [Myotis myotis]
MQNKIEVQSIKAESEATTRKILEEVQKKNEQRWKETEKNYQEHVKRLEEMEKGRAEEAWNAKHKLQECKRENEQEREQLLEKNKELKSNSCLLTEIENMMFALFFVLLVLTLQYFFH